MSLSKTIYEVFFENSVAYAEGYLNQDNKVAYTTIDGLPDLQKIEDHFNGLVTLGAYTVNKGSNTVCWAAFDIDSKAGGLEAAREIAKKISEYLRSRGIPHAIEFSGSKGYHILIFFKQKEPADRVKACLEQIRDQLALPKNGDPHVEVYPKQDSLSDKPSAYGNLLRVPLGKHPKTDKITFFVDTEKWEEGDPLDPDEIFSQKIDLVELENVIKENDDFEKTVTILSQYWASGQRHNISLYLSGYLASLGWTEDEVIELLEAIYAVVPEGDIVDQTKTTTSTFKKFYAGESIAGMSGLSTILPAATLNELHNLVTKKNSSSAMLTVDRIRLGKGATFLKIRSAAMAILSSLAEEGRLVRDTSDTYWLNNQNYRLTAYDSLEWERYLHNFYGINMGEAFGRQTVLALKHLSYDRAKEVIVKKRAYWDREYGYINLGGPEIYLLSGDKSKREVIYNGEIDILFKNSQDSFRVPNLLTMGIDPLNPWTYLTDDVNFADGDDGMTGVQQCQLVRAYFLSTFFAEVMPTKPILTFLGVSGNGKTTAARRLLRVLEGPSAEVLTVNSDKEDSFRASVVAHRYIVIDNLEKSFARWLPDSLNRLSTGAKIELRELHTTNRVREYEVNCFATVTATNMPFSDETVYTRMLPILLGKVRGRKNEDAVQSDLINNFNGIWLGLFDVLDEVIYELKTVKTVVAPNEVRLADFSVFCSRIKGASSLDGDELMKAVGNLTNRQKQTLQHNTPFIDILNSYMMTVPSGDTGFMSAADIFARFQKTAKLIGAKWLWANSSALSKHILMLEDPLIQNFGMVIRTTRENGRDVKLYKFIVTKKDVQ